VDCREKLYGDFESVCLALMMAPEEYDAYLIHKAIEVSQSSVLIQGRVMICRSLCQPYLETEQ